MTRGKGKLATLVVLVIALAVLSFGVLALREALLRRHAREYEPSSSQQGGAPHSGDGSDQGSMVGDGEIPEGLSIDHYSWEQLSEISAEIASAGGGDASRLVASRYGIVAADGTLAADTKAVRLADGTEIEVRVVGICQDVREDGGLVGLTFMTCSPITVAPLGVTGDTQGRWRECALRGWLAGEGADLLPEELREAIIPAAKTCVGPSLGGDGFASFTCTDVLWLPSVPEVCGDVDWFVDEYGDEYAYLDEAINREGTQYEWFSQAGVTSRKDHMEALVVSYDGTNVGWWYRTAFPFTYDEMPESFFYQVSDTGYPCAYSDSDTVLGVVVGFCV